VSFPGRHLEMIREIKPWNTIFETKWRKS